MELLVIPNKSDYGIAWCIDYALKMTELGRAVTILDLSNYQFRYRKISKRIYEKLLNKRPILKLLKLLIKQGILEETFEKKKVELSHPTPPCFSDVIESTIRSVYAFEFGSNSIRIDDIDRSVVVGETEIFNKIYQIVHQKILELKPDKVVTVNGRFVVDSAAILAARKLNVTASMLERTSENYSYYSEQYVSSQSPSEVFEIINQVWERDSKVFTESQMEKIARDFFRRKGRFSSVDNFENFGIFNPFFLKNAAIFFPTSDHEFAIYNPYNSAKIFSESQELRFVRALNILKELGLEVIVRTHPHPVDSHVGAIEDKIWSDFCNIHDAHFISSTDPIDSYYLASKSAINIVGVSSIGAEIAYAGFPIVLIDESTYGFFLPELFAESDERLVQLLVARSRLLDYSRLNAWGYYMATGQNKMRFIEMTGTDSFIAFGKNWAVPRKRISHFLGFLIRTKKRLIR